MLFWITFFLAVVFVYIKIIKPLNHWEKLKVPFVKPWPIIGNMSLINRVSMAHFAQQLYNAHQNTRYMGVYHYLTPALLIKDIDLLKKLGIKHFNHFVDHKRFVNKDIDPLFGNNLLNSSGDKWRSLRATLSPAFSGSKMRSMFILVSECAEQVKNYFLEIADPDKPITIEMKDIFTRYACDVIATTAYGINNNSFQHKDNEFYKYGQELTNFEGFRMFKLLISDWNPKLTKLFNIKILNDETCNFFTNVIKNNMKSREDIGIVRPDMVHLLMEAKKGNLKHEEKDEITGSAMVEESDIGKDSRLSRIDLTDDDIIAQAIIFFIGGFATISTPMCHLSYELALNEDIQKRLQEEIDETLKECKGNLSYDIVMKMKYLDMCVSEILRKWPSVGVTTRCCVEPYTIPPERPGEVPIHLQKGDLIWFPIYALHHDPQNFPNPEKFDPERFSDKNKVNIKSFSYIPFGIGPRNCIASRLALMEAKLVFIKLLSTFSFEICEKSQVPLKIKSGQFAVTAERGFWLGLKLRK